MRNIDFSVDFENWRLTSIFWTLMEFQGIDVKGLNVTAHVKFDGDL